MDDVPALLALLHQGLATTARTRLDDATRSIAATDLHVNFTGPAMQGMTVQGRVTGGGRTVCFCEAEARAPQGQLVARAMGTFRYGASLTR